MLGGETNYGMETDAGGDITGDDYLSRATEDSGYTDDVDLTQYTDNGIYDQTYTGDPYAYTDDSYTDTGYADAGYADNGYTDTGYADAGYGDNGYADTTYADGYYDENSVLQTAY